MYRAHKLILTASQSTGQANQPEARNLELVLDIPIPFSFIGKIVSWIWQRVTRLILYKTYSESHQRWVSHNRFGSLWEPLGEHLEYCLRLAQPTDPMPHISKVAVRSIGQTLANVDVYLEAYGAGLRYQEKLSFCEVNQNPIIWNLTNIPTQELLRLSEHRINFSIEEIQFRQCVVRLSNGEVLPPENSMLAYLTHNWILNDEWVHRWGNFWNCNAIMFAKGELSNYWHFGFGLPKTRVYLPHIKSSYRKPFWQSFFQGIGWVMALPPLVTAQFWLAIWSGLFVMDKDDRLCFRWSAKGREEDKVKDSS